MKILEAYGIPTNIVKAIKDMYTNTRAKVVSPDGETELFEIKAGVLQRDTVAPYLFIIALDYALQIAVEGREEELGFQLNVRRSRRVGPEAITDLDVADDMVLLSGEIDQAQELLNRVESAAASVGLIANAKKTKVMSFNQPKETKITTADGTCLEVVAEFTYLGLPSSSRADIKRRIALAWAACNSLAKIWRSALSRKLKLRS